MESKVRLLAFHLPQFHPIPENDRAWGKGFTEWTNVTKARPVFRGHHQPHLPSDLGFYDLRLPEARYAQAELAREYGIYGYCYYHYWFHGRRLLERPVNEILDSGQPDFPFCLCWANEHWTRRWDGLENEIIVRQEYSDVDDLAHIRWLCEKPFRDSRYVRIDGKPVFLIYRALRLPDVRKTLGIWRAEARRQGIGEIYLCRVETFVDEVGDPSALDFDAAVEFQPDWKNLGPRLCRGKSLRGAYADYHIFDYATTAERMLRKPSPAYKRYPCVTPGWDNSPRKRSDGLIIHGSTPELYERWLTKVLRKFRPYSIDENLAFINAWNEWAEGNHLEPCTRWGRAYLEATRHAVEISCQQIQGENSASKPAGISTMSPFEESASACRHQSDWPPAREFHKPTSARELDLPAVFRELRELHAGFRSTAELEKRLFEMLDGRNLFLHLYNFASVAQNLTDTETAHALFEVLSELTQEVNPSLAGKCLYKLAVLTGIEAHVEHYLEKCLRLCPEHQAARKWLDKIKMKASCDASF